MTLDEAIRYCEEVVKDEELRGYIVNKKFGDITTYGEEHYKCANVNRQLAKLLKELKYARVLLKASYEIFKKCDDSSYVLNVLEQTTVYDGVECDGYCLMEDIEAFMEEWND